MTTPGSEKYNSRRMGPATEIRIDVDQAGNITIDPYYAIVHRGSRLVWKAAEGVTWAVGFQNSRTPTKKKAIQGHGAAMDGEHIGSKPGHFPYCVAVLGQGRRMLAGKPAIFLEPACPVIIID